MDGLPTTPKTPPASFKLTDQDIDHYLHRLSDIDYTTQEWQNTGADIKEPDESTEHSSEEFDVLSDEEPELEDADLIEEDFTTPETSSLEAPNTSHQFIVLPRTSTSKEFRIKLWSRPFQERLSLQTKNSLN